MVFVRFRQPSYGRIIRPYRPYHPTADLAATWGRQRDEENPCRRIVDLAARNPLPLTSMAREFVESGNLMS